jgi:single-strand DNA-binding protein
MPNVNIVIIAGFLTRDPEMRYTQKGSAVAQGGIAVNRTWKTETGETREEVTFVDWTAFGRTAEVMSQYLKKGKPVLLQGRLKLDQWDDKQTGAKRSHLKVIAESFQFLESGGGKQEGSAPAGGRTRQPAPAQEQPPIEEDDVPF